MTEIAVAGAMLALGFADRALAVAPAPTQSAAVAARAHLSYKPDEGAFEGALTVVEQRIALAAADRAPAAPSADTDAGIRQVSPLSVRYLIFTHTSDGSGLSRGSVREAWPRCELAQLAGPPAT